MRSGPEIVRDQVVGPTAKAGEPRPGAQRGRVSGAVEAGSISTPMMWAPSPKARAAAGAAVDAEGDPTGAGAVTVGAGGSTSSSLSPQAARATDISANAHNADSVRPPASRERKPMTRLTIIVDLAADLASRTSLSMDRLSFALSAVV